MKSFVAFLLCFWSLLAFAQQAGRIEQVEGDARVYDKAQTMRTVKVGDAVTEGDTIVTGAGGEVHLAMADEGQIAVRPNTRMTIAKYRADGGNTDTSIISLVQGALRSVTGWIGKYNPKGYAIRTPTATIGVRGTDHETMVVAKGGEGEAGTYDKVNHGETLLSTKQGQTVVRPNQAGFASLAGKTKPRVLASVPHFFRPAKLDTRFQKLHENVHQRIETKRKERIEKIREQRQKIDAAKQSRAHQAEQRKLQHDAQHPAAAARREQIEKRHEQRRQLESGKHNQLPAHDDARKRFSERTSGAANTGHSGGQGANRPLKKQELPHEPHGSGHHR